MVSEGLEINTENYELVTTIEAAGRLGVTEKTVYNRYKNGILKGEHRPDRLYIWVRKQSEILPTGEKISNTPEIFPTTSNAFQKMVEDMTQLSNRVLELSEKHEKLIVELSEKKSEVIVLNREMEARNSQIVKHKDDEREIQKLRAQIQELQKENERLQKRTWWPFK